MLKITFSFFKETLWHKACLYPHDRRRDMLNTSTDTLIHLFVWKLLLDWIVLQTVLTKKQGVTVRPQWPPGVLQGPSSKPQSQSVSPDRKREHPEKRSLFFKRGLMSCCICADALVFSFRPKKWQTFKQSQGSSKERGLFKKMYPLEVFFLIHTESLGILFNGGWDLSTVVRQSWRRKVSGYWFTRHLGFSLSPVCP